MLNQAADITVSKERRIRMNLIPALNLSFAESIKRTKLSMLSRSKITDDQGNIIGYRATLLVVEDHNKYVKRDGEVVEGPNSLQTFNVQVNSSNVPDGNGMITNIQLVNPRIVSNYAASQTGSTFAQIHVTIICDDINIGDGREQQHQSFSKIKGGK